MNSLEVINTTLFDILPLEILLATPTTRMLECSRKAQRKVRQTEHQDEVVTESDR